MKPPIPLAAILLAAIPLPAAEIEHGTFDVKQLDGGTSNTSLVVSLPHAASPGLMIDHAATNRGDYAPVFSPPDNRATGLMMATVAENGRDNEDVGGPTGTYYPTCSIAESGTRYFIAIHRPQENSSIEFNINTAFAYFPFDDWIGGVATNNTNGGTITAVRGSPGVGLSNLSYNGDETYTLDLTGLGAHSQQGILLINGAKNENNYGLSRANANGTFRVYVHDNGEQGFDLELDPFAFVFVPMLHGSSQIAAMGRANGDASTDISAGDFTLTKGGAGTWFLSIPGQSPDTGTLILSAEGFDTFNVDNMVSHQWDPNTLRWVIESRDLPLAGLQDLGAAEDAFSFAFITHPTSTIFVDPSATGSNDGRSWVNAFTDLQSALAVATSGSTILVAEGVYTPGEFRSDSFHLVDGAELYGGFPSGGSTFEFRDPVAHLTILSGDIEGDDSQSPVATDQLTLTGTGDNSYNVVRGDNLGTGTLVDGFTITAGFAAGPDPTSQSGGGLRLVSSSPVLRNLVISGNLGQFLGGGLYNSAGNPTLDHVQFIGNRAAANSGGGMWTGGASPVIKDCVFRNNHCFQFNGGGGGINIADDCVLTNVLFVGNSARGSSGTGGAVRIVGGSPTLTNVTLAGNGATNGGALHNQGGSPLLFNCLLWGNLANTNPTLNGDPIDPASSHNLIEGVGGATDPLFIRDPDPGDGLWYTTGDNDYGDLQLQGSSPAIGTGDNTANSEPFDLIGNPRIVRTDIDLGAYEATSPPWMVDLAATGSNTGMSWSDAFTDLQLALFAAGPGDPIWVAQGSYTPTSGTDRDTYFIVSEEVEIYGGFPTGGSPFGDRDPSAYPATLSGEINTAATTDNSFHVVEITGNALLDGFTITGGYAEWIGASDVPSDADGAGIYIHDAASPTLRDLTITANHATGLGGAVRIDEGTGPVFEDVLFSDNSADDDGGAVSTTASSSQFHGCNFTGNSSDATGGAMANDTAPAVIIDDCFFEGNTATGIGGALHNLNSSLSIDGTTFLANESTTSSGGCFYNNGSVLTVTSCALLGNEAATGAGGIRNAGASEFTLINSLLSGNRAATDGGAMFSSQGSQVTIINSTVVANSAPTGGGIYSFDLGAVIQNSIVWANTAMVSGNLAGVPLDPASSHNNIQGLPGALDPDFINYTGADNMPGTLDDDPRLEPGSPSIGQGDNALVPAGLTSDLDGNPRIQALAVDQGAYESTVLGAVITDVRGNVPRGEAYTLSDWVPDASAFNGGAGFGFTFNLIGTTGNLSFLGGALPVVNADGSLSFTFTPETIGTATLEVTISDPGSTYGTSRTRTFTISSADIYYVDQSVVGGAADGSSWSNAFPELRTALDTAPLLLNDEIWVAEGSYSPTGDSNNSLTFRENIGVYGGFPSGGGTFAARNTDPASNNSVLTGNNTWRHVVVFEDDLTACVLDGFVIEDGAAFGSGISYQEEIGAGMVIRSGATPLLQNLLIRNNDCNADGGGVYVEATLSSNKAGPVFRSVTFDNNSAGQDGGAVRLQDRDCTFESCTFTNNDCNSEGGAVYLQDSASSLSDCFFGSNTGFNEGGAMFLSDRTCLIERTTFTDNQSTSGSGGAIAVFDTKLTATNVAFLGNRADRGGAFYHQSTGLDPQGKEIDTEPVITNGLFAGNRADLEGGAIYNAGTRLHLTNSTVANNEVLGGEGGGGFYNGGERPSVRNSIVWGNTGSPGAQIAGDPFHSSSANNLVEGGTSEGARGVLSTADPLFLDPAGPDLQIGTIDDNFGLQDTSPAISLGEDSFVPAGVDTDLAGNDRFYPLAVDLGAYESEVFAVPGTPVDLALPYLSDGSLLTVTQWVSPHMGLNFEFKLLGTSGSLAFNSLPNVLENGSLEFALAAGTFGRAQFEVLVTNPGGQIPPQPPFSFEINAGNEPVNVYPNFSLDYTATTHITSNNKTARIRGYLQDGPRKGIAIFPDGFSESIPTWVDKNAGNEVGSSKWEIDGIAVSAYKEGFDVYTVSWHDPRTYIEDNAMILAELLEDLAGPGLVTAAGTQSIAPDEKLALIPVSMGGLVSRFALCYLDTNAIPYHCDLFMTVDSPHEGAHIPVGFQQLAIMLDEVPDTYTSGFDTKQLVKSVDAIKQPAPREMLLVHYSRAGNASVQHAVERDAFLNLLENVYGGWPTNPNMRMAAIASGRGDGMLEQSGEGEFTLPKPGGYTLLDYSGFPQVITEETTHIPATTCFVGDLWFKVKVDFDVTVFASNPSTPGDASSSTTLNPSTVATIEVEGSETEFPYRTFSGETEIDYSGTPTEIKVRLREWIKENGTANGLTCDVLNSDIDDAIDEFLDDLVALQNLNTNRTAYSRWHWDYVPGGLRDTGQTTASALGSAGFVLDVAPRHCFIPTVSALALSSTLDPYGSAIPPDASDDSPFDVLYHFGTHTNTTHLADIGGWLSDIVTHELKQLCGEFRADLDDAPNSVSYFGPYILEEYDTTANSWFDLLEEDNGLYLLPVPPPHRGIYRLLFPEVFE